MSVAGAPVQSVQSGRSVQSIRSLMDPGSDYFSIKFHQNTNKFMKCDVCTNQVEHNMMMLTMSISFMDDAFRANIRLSAEL